MKYLFLVYADGARPAAAGSAGEPAAADVVFHSGGELLREEGYLLNALYMRSAASASAVRLRGGEFALPDDSSNEARNQLAALYIINARDLNEAVRVASRLPQAQHSLVEVRPLLDFDWLSG